MTDESLENIAVVIGKGSVIETDTKEDVGATFPVSAMDELEKLAAYLLTNWPEEITNGSAVDVAINIMDKLKGEKINVSVK